MSAKTTRALMKCVGATLAVCSAVAMVGGCQSNSHNAKKTMKKRQINLPILSTRCRICYKKEVAKAPEARQ